jgi:phytol kinase
LLAVYVAAGIFAEPLSVYLPAVTAIALVCTLVESLPFRDIDNISVPLTAVVLGTLLFL